MPRLVVALLVLLASLGPARADDGDGARHTYRAVVDRVDLERASVTGLRLRVYLTAVALEGKLLDLTDPKTIKLYLGSREKKAPYALGTYDETDSDTAIVVLVQSTIDFSEALPHIADALDRDLLASLPDRTQIAVLPFGETITSGKLGAVKSARGKLSLTTDNSAGDPALLDTLDRALLLLKKAKTTPEGRPLRKIVVIVGDGRDMAADHDRVTRTGERAAKQAVRIHSIAFSAADARRPMLALGELSKRSLGTFRWVRTAGADAWKAAFGQLRDEINKQYVLTYFVSTEDDIAGKRLHIVTVGRTEATSNELKVPSPSCAGVECTTGYCAGDTCVKYRDGGGRGILGWILIIVGGLVGLVVLLGVIGYFMTRAQQRQQQAQAMYPGMQYGQAGMYPGMQQPGMPQQPGMQQPGMPQPGMPMPMPMPMPVAAKPKKQKKQKGGVPVVAPGLLPNGRPIPALLIMNGPRTGERHLLRNGFLIGKQPGCDLMIEDGFTSSQHAQIGMDAGGNCKVYDRGSTNGTYINGVRVTESALQHGVSIKIGATEIRFLAE